MQEIFFEDEKKEKETIVIKREPCSDMSDDVYHYSIKFANRYGCGEVN